MDDIRQQYKDVPGLEFQYPEENFYQFFTRDGLKLYTYRYKCLDLKCLVFLFHGLHGHSNMHAVVAKYLSDTGCECVAIDMRGHGKSEGVRGLVDSFDNALEDCIKFINEISELYPVLPIFIGGHSIGGCLSVHISCILKEKIKGMILIAPAMGSSLRGEGLARGICKVLNYCWPNLPLLRANPLQATSDLRTISYLLSDPLIIHERAMLGTVSSALNGMRDARNLIERVSTPFIIVQGSADPVIGPEKVQNLYKNAPVIDKLLFMYEGMSHGVLFDKEIYRICSNFQEWISVRYNN